METETDAFRDAISNMTSVRWFHLPSIQEPNAVNLDELQPQHVKFHEHQEIMDSLSTSSSLVSQAVATRQSFPLRSRLSTEFLLRLQAVR
jgi:hypothetical protein